MRLIKILFITICLATVVNMCHAAEYYCGDVKQGYQRANLYDSGKTAKEKCKWLRTDIIISDTPMKYTYKQCVNEFNAAKTKYDKGLCTPVIAKNHPWKNYKCVVKSVKNTSQIIEVTCNFEDTLTDEQTHKKFDAALTHFQKMYYESFGMHYED